MHSLRIVSLASLTIAASALAQSPARHSISGASVAIYNVAGHVEIVAGSGSDVAVLVTTAGGDAKALRVEQGSRDGINDLRVVYPDADVIYPALGRWSNATFAYSRDGYFNGGHQDRGHQLRVRGSGSGTDAWADLRVEVPAGKRVTMNLAAGEVVATNIKGHLRIDVGSAKVRARGVDGELSIDAGSGGVVAEDVTGDTDIDTGSGGVEVTNITGGRLKINTGSGGIRGSRITSADLDVDVGSGGVDLDRISSPHAVFDVGSGGLTLGFTTSPKSLKVDTGSGGATLTFPASLSAEVELEAGSGSITNDFAVQMTRMDRHYVRGRIGSGEGRISVETGSGGVRLRKSGTE